MFGWIKRLFLGMDRAEVAAERIALAVEGIADDLEAVRASMRQRFGLDETPVSHAALAAASPPAPAEEPVLAGNGDGRKKHR